MNNQIKNRRGLSLMHAGAMFVIAFVLIPTTAHCGWFSSLTDLSESNGKEVATKVVTLDEEMDIWGLDFSPDGKYLAATSPSVVSPPSNKVEVHVWDWQSNEMVRRLEKATGANDGLSTEAIRFSPDGHLLAACHSRATGNVVARIWNASTWEFVHDIDEPIGGGGCNAIGFSHDGKSLIRVLSRSPQFSGDNLIVYDTSNWQPIWGVRTIPFYPVALAINRDGELIAIGGRVINPKSWPFSTPVPSIGTPPLPNTALIAIVDLAKHEFVRYIKIPQDVNVDRLAWSPDGTQISSGGGSGLEIFNVHTGELIVNEITDGRHVLVRYTPDGKYLIESGFGNGGSKVRIWDGQHRELLQEIPAMPGSMAVSRDGHYLALGGNKKIMIWHLK